MENKELIEGCIRCSKFLGPRTLAHVVRNRETDRIVNFAPASQDGTISVPVNGVFETLEDLPLIDVLVYLNSYEQPTLFAAVVKSYRERLLSGNTQAAVARLLGVNLRLYQKWEAGTYEPMASAFWRLVQVLRIDSYWLDRAFRVARVELVLPAKVEETPGCIQEVTLKTLPKGQKNK